MTENAVKVQNGSKGPISSKWLYWHKIVKVNPKEDQKSKTDKKKAQRHQKGPNEPKWPRMVQNSLKGPKLPKRTKIAQDHPKLPII